VGSLRDNDEICARDLIDWGDPRFPEVGDLLTMIDGSQLLGWPDKPVSGIVIAITLGFSEKKGVHVPMWRVMWGNVKIDNTMSLIGESWFESGFIIRYRDVQMI